MSGRRPSALLVASRPSPASGQTALARLRALLDDGWDAHIALDGAPAAAAAPAALGDPELAGRVHLSSAHLPAGLASRLRFPAAVACAAARHPIELGTLLLGGEIPPGQLLRGRDVAAAVLALRPGVIHFDSVGAAGPRGPAARIAGAGVIVAIGERDLESDARAGLAALREAGATLHFPTARSREYGATVAGPEHPADAVVPEWATDSQAATGALAREPLGDRPLRLLTAAPLNWQAGHEWALDGLRRAVAQGLRCEYRIAGDGEFPESVWFARHQLGLREEVEILGPESLPSHLRWADAYLDASVTPGHGHVLEALAAGLALIATDAVELPDGAECLRVPTRDPSAIAEALTSLAGDDELARRLGESGPRSLPRPGDAGEAGREFARACRRALVTPLG